MTYQYQNAKVGDENPPNPPNYRYADICMHCKHCNSDVTGEENLSLTSFITYLCELHKVMVSPEKTCDDFKDF